MNKAKADKLTSAGFHLGDISHFVGLPEEVLDRAVSQRKMAIFRNNLRRQRTKMEQDSIKALTVDGEYSHGT